MYRQYKNLTIRNAVQTDAEKLTCWWRDRNVMVHAGYSNEIGTTPEEVAGQLSAYKDSIGRRLVLEECGEAIGEASYYCLENNRAEISLKIYEYTKQEKGLEKVYLSMLIDCLFDMGIEEICLDANLNNLSEQHVYEKLGFEKTGIRKDVWRDQLGVWQSIIDYTITKNKFHTFIKTETYPPISYSQLFQYAYSSDKLIKGDIQGIVLDFTGLNGTGMQSENSEWAEELAEDGIVLLHPYINPWAWMNRDAVKLTDETLDTLIRHYDLSDNLPIVSQGGSMGGLCALTYAVYARRKPAAVAANCPVCDLPYHYTERPDLPRTLLSAFGGYEMPLVFAMETASPYHLAKRDAMPDIPYYIVHCAEDKAVNKSMHSEKLLKIMGQNREITYHVVEERGHCDLTPEARREYRAFIVAVCKERWV